MGVVLFLGCFLIAYTLPIFLFINIVTKRSQLVIITISAAFFWLLSVMVASAIWALVGNNSKDLLPMAATIGVIFQEAGRYSFYRMYIAAESKIKVLTNNPGGPKLVLPLNDVSSALAAGIGVGGMNAVLFHGAVLASSTGRGTYYLDSCTGMNIFFTSAITALLYEVLHISLMHMGFVAFRKNSYGLMTIVVLVHLSASATTWLNTTSFDYGCAWSLSLLTIIVCITSAAAVLLLQREYP